MKQTYVLLALESAAQKNWKSFLKTDAKSALTRGKLEEIMKKVSIPDSNFFLSRNPDKNLSDLVLARPTQKVIEELLEFWKHKETLNQKGLGVPQKILFTGPPGTGKTSTAKAIAKELEIPLFVVNFPSIGCRQALSRNPFKIFKPGRSGKGNLANTSAIFCLSRPLQKQEKIYVEA